jgi:hypothetical protein
MDKSQAASMLGKLSVKKRFGGKTKEEISAMMKKVSDQNKRINRVKVIV